MTLLYRVRHCMPRASPKLILAATRAATAKRIVADQQALIARLQDAGQPTLEAEKALQTYVSALQHLEDYERKIRNERKAKKAQTRKKNSNLITPKRSLQ